MRASQWNHVFSPSSVSLPFFNSHRGGLGTDLPDQTSRAPSAWRHACIVSKQPQGPPWSVPGREGKAVRQGWWSEVSQGNTKKKKFSFSSISGVLVVVYADISKFSIIFFSRDRAFLHLSISFLTFWFKVTPWGNCKFEANHRYFNPRYSTNCLAQSSLVFLSFPGALEYNSTATFVL